MLRKQHELAKLQQELVAEEAQRVVAEVRVCVHPSMQLAFPSPLLSHPPPLILPSLHLILLPSIQIQPLAIPAHALHTLTSIKDLESEEQCEDEDNEALDHNVSSWRDTELRRYG